MQRHMINNENKAAQNETVKSNERSHQQLTQNSQQKAASNVAQGIAKVQATAPDIKAGL